MSNLTENQRLNYYLPEYDFTKRHKIVIQIYLSSATDLSILIKQVVAWNFYIEQNDDGTATLSTEIRILCLGERVKSSFRLYWANIRPYSGWIRLEMLKMIKEQAEGNIT